MSALLPGFAHDVFISYRGHDNHDKWITQLEERLRKVLRTLIKGEDLSIYFDQNFDDGLRENQLVDECLAPRLQAFILLPVVSYTYCELNKYAWKSEFLPFVAATRADSLGLAIRLTNGQVSSRVLPVRIHQIEVADEQKLKETLGTHFRPIDFAYTDRGTSRPLSPDDDGKRYRDQLNQLAFAIKDLLEAAQTQVAPPAAGDGAAPAAETAAAPAPRYHVRTGNDFPNWELELPLFGRHRELEALDDHLRTAHRVMLTGAGGLGKTKLAAVLADTSPYPGGVVWYRLSAAETPEKAAASLENLNVLLREHLNLPPTADANAVWAALGRSQTLLVLDNAEDCQHPEQYIERLNRLDVRGGTAVLITSRFKWDKLRNGVPYPLEELAPEYAAQLFRTLAALAVPNRALADADVARLVEAARYHPRLLTVAAPLLQNDSIQDVTDLLGSLKGEKLEAAVKEIVQHTLDLLKLQPDGKPALAALRRLVVFRGGFTKAAATALLGRKPNALKALLGWLLRFIGARYANTFLGLGDNLKALNPLLAWNLLRFDGTRYDTDPLVREVVAADATAHSVHLDYYEALARQHHGKQDYLGFDPESANLEAAFEWAMAAGETAKAYWLVNAASEFLQNRGRFAQALAWLQRLEAALPAAADPRLRAALEVSLGSSYWSQPLGNRAANLRRAIGAYENALRHRTETAAPLDYATTQNNLGNAYQDLAAVEDRAANLRRAIGAFENALRHYTETAAPLDYAMTQNNLGIAYQNLAAVEDRAANLRRAIGAYGNALRHHTETAAPLHYAMTQNNLGTAYGELAAVEDRAANLRRAIGAFENALRHRTETAAPLDYAMTQNNLGNTYRDLAVVEDRVENLRRAIGAYENALRHYTEAAVPLHYATTQKNLGIAYEDAADLPAAIACWQHAERAYRHMGDTDNADLMLDWIKEAQAQPNTPPTPET